MQEIVIVGASLAGLRAAETLRAEGFDGRLTLVGAEAALPYDRPPLSKEVLQGRWTAEQCLLRRQGLDDLSLDLRLGCRAEALDVGSRHLQLGDGSKVGFDGLVIATGARVRRLDAGAQFQGVFYLRTQADALALRDALVPGARVVVVGAGFIGAEVAASCRALDLSVTMIEALDVPLGRVLGPAMGQVCADLHRDNGVDLRTGVGVAAIEGDARVEHVRLSDGSVVECDVVVIGVGVVPETEWLRDSGLTLEDGVLCDAWCATEVEGIVACGDVARWFNPRYGRHMRLEHWTNTGAMASVAARRLLHGAEATTAHDHVPYFWSDQYKVKIQLAGLASAEDEVRIVHGSVEERRFVALHGREGALVAVFAMRRPRHVMEYLAMIEEGVSFEDALAREI
jgi:NADPH-dependent 2,4-dienoyl-CoA reductase/sulfur reductase-like enzyme